jgi:hypothetical protein
LSQYEAKPFSVLGLDMEGMAMEVFAIASIPAQ